MRKLKRRASALGLLLGSFTLSVVAFQNCSGGGFVPLDGVAGSSSFSSLAGDPTAALPPGNQVPVPVPVGGVITDLKLESLSATAEQTNLPISVGQVFAPGSLASSDLLVGRLEDGSILPVQVDVKATHAGGSVRHALLSFVLPKLAANAKAKVDLIKATGPRAPSALTPADLVRAKLNASVKINLGGTMYSASAEELITSPQAKSWASGAIAHEWLVMAPLKNVAGMAHPHLTARFAIRAYAGQSRGKVDVILENNWAYEPGPQNFLYDVEIRVGGQQVYTKMGLNHLHHARWKKTFWWGSAPEVHVRHNAAYIIATRAVPNYDQSIPLSEAHLQSFKTNWAGPGVEPMGSGLANPYMPSTGGRPDIGLSPDWAVSYLLSQDKRAKEVTLGMGELGGSWSAHYRDRNSDRPLSIVDWPYSTLLGRPGDTVNPKTGKSEAFPGCAGNCETSNVDDTAHLPNFAYIPYLVTADHYFLEELQFWAMFVVFNHNPYYRNFEAGLVKADQLRGQGWSLRLLAEAAYITPDADVLKSHFKGFVQSNLNYYNAEYTNNSNANKLGVIINGYSISYNGGRGVAPWMDDFFTQAVGHAYELGFDAALPLLQWKAKYQIGRMVDPGFCWINGGVYSLNIRDSEISPFYTTLGEAYRASVDSKVVSMPCGGAEMAAFFGIKVGEMTGYSPYNAGYPSNYQPALAMAVDSGAPNGAKAWQTFMARTVKPDYQNGPQFSIIPRK